MSTLTSKLSVIARLLTDQFRQRGAVGKVLMLFAGLILSCCLCSIPLAIFAPDPTPTPVVAEGLGEEAEGVAQASATTVAATETPLATDTTAPTSTPVLTDTPAPTVTPAPSDTVVPATALAIAPANTVSPTVAPSATAAPTVVPTTTTATAVAAGIPPGDQATVINIVDGDTIDVLMGGQEYRVRYIGMDTPERGDPFFGEATTANRNLVQGQDVILVKDVSETDRFGRLLRYVYLLNGTFVNAELVRAGFAQIATYPPDVRHVDTFAALQQEARENGRGLWGGVAVVPDPTQEPQPTAPAAQPTEPAPPATAQIVISFILYDGAVSRVESDEYAVITNQGGAAVNLGGWRLNAGAPGQDFSFPSFDLQPGQSCRVYTNQDHPDTCGFSFRSGEALWNNNGDCGYLYDSSGAEVSQYCYQG